MKMLKTISPVDGREYVTRPLATGAQIEATLAAARKAKDGWRRTKLAERVAALTRFGIATERDGDRLRLPVSARAEVNNRLLTALGLAPSSGRAHRTGEAVRDTKETRIVCAVDLDATGPVSITTGVGFFDHMLEQVAAHGGFSLRLACEGDLHTDPHHTIEDSAIALGQALKQALGERRGIARYGFVLPMDEANASVSIDLSGRPFPVFEGRFATPFIGDYRKSDDNCCVEVIGLAPTGVNANAYSSIYRGVTFLGDDTRQVKQDLQMRSTEEAWGVSLQGDIDVGMGTFTTITAYRTWDATEYREGDWIDVAAPYVGNPFAQLHDFGPQTTKTISQEFRLASRGGEMLDYVLGAYYSKTESERFFQRNIFNCTATTLAADATGQRPCRAGSSTFVSTFSNATFGADFKNIAAFADGTWNISDSARLIAGLRWTQDDLSYFHNRVPTPFAGQPGILTSLSGFKGSNKSDNVSGRAGLQYDLNDDVMVYASYARGYKGPAYNVFFNMGPNNTAVIDAETADSIELGLKSTLLDGMMLLNAAVFDAKYDDFQANNFLFLNGTLITTLTNAGEVSSKGFEVDVQAKPTDMVTLGAGVAYTDAKVDNFFTPPGQNATVRAGTKLPLAPEWKASLLGELAAPVGSYTLTTNAVVAFQSSSFSDLNEPAALRIPGYTTVDLTVALTDASDRFRVALIGRNLADKSYTVLKTGGGPGGAARLQIPRDADRYFGIQARFNFGAK
jgi:iron complex outermembrane receptor protein